MQVGRLGVHAFMSGRDSAGRPVLASCSRVN